MAATTTASEQVPAARTEDNHAHIDPAAQLLRTYEAPVQTRSERPHSFEPADFGEPNGHEVNWKHTPIARVRPLFAVATGDDAVQYEVSDERFVQPPLAIGVAPRGETFRPEDVVSAVAWQGSSQALHVRVPRGEEVAEPITVSITGTSAHDRADAHLVIEAEANSQATVVLNHSGAAQYAQNVEILVREGARLTVIAVQDWDRDAVHAASHQAVVAKDASLRHFVVSFGGDLVRVNPSILLAGAGSHADVYGVGFCDAGQHLESQVFVHHEGVATRANVLYKTALQGTDAHTVWVGDVLIGRNAVDTDSYEANRNLALTPGARADSIPNLEIEIGDIRGAGHASATGRFDDEQLFYLQARGISELEARRLVVLGFLSEVIQRIGIPSLETQLISHIERELADDEMLAPAEATA
ncbi:Fe-S cluster assembly protein SufD [Microbacterium terrisoli]|jgi:Fe-S cluster assembly protein SufD|uniref:Fe-S cluster assembly protein SufD n=1 Tax=Microbacterium terrisoli TaxID=3242192 RepID=UPI002804992D|nr:Fe-S cluster assembly protein SufD [Microbacterium protaetiae]